MMQHIVESQQFDLPFMERIFTLAEEMRNFPGKYRFPDKILATLFYEPSTRTRFSFETAMLKLGGQVITSESAMEFSSHSKGETLEDTIKIVSNYADVIAMRHHEIGSAKRAAKVAKAHMINAGDGAGQHPTQALLDLYTIRHHFGTLDGLTIAMVGDLLYGRTVRSLCYLFGRFFKANLIFVAPPICRMGQDIKDYLTEQGARWAEEEDLEKAMVQADVIYMTRIQKERFLDMQHYEQASNKYRIGPENLASIKPSAIVMHPLPRKGEIDPAVDEDPRMKYFEQAANGVWVRMALIAYLLDPKLR